jgi:signal peptidase I, bacterial type
MKEKWNKIWKEWMKPLFVVLIITSAFRSAVADWYDVPTGSMKPTIIEGDRIFVNKLAYDLKFPFTSLQLAHWDDPRRGDIVVFYSPYDGKRLVKRVVGLPDDRIELVNNYVYANGKIATHEPLSADIIDQLSPVDREHSQFAEEKLTDKEHPVMLSPMRPSLRSFGPVRVPQGQYFVMGDNRDNSFDSRWFGFVERGRIVGRALTVVASLNPDRHYLPRWHRFLTPLP